MKVTNAKSCYIENLGKGEFKMTALPLEVQSAPIFGMLTEDFNGDGNLDILMVGNDFGNEISIGRLDAFHGALLLGNGKGGFKLETLAKSGFVVSGDGKGLVRIQTPTGKNLILATQNRGALRVFNLDQKSMAVKPNDVYGTVIYRNGKKRKVEFQYGSSFFSQSSRSMLTENLKKIEITNNKSEKRQHEFK